MRFLELLNVLLCLLSLGFAGPVPQERSEDGLEERDTPTMSDLYKSFLREHSPMAPGSRYVFTNKWDLATDKGDDQAMVDTRKSLGFNHISMVVAEVLETKVGGNTHLDIKAVFWDMVISNTKTKAIDVRAAKPYISKPKSQQLTWVGTTKKADKAITTSGQSYFA